MAAAFAALAVATLPAGPAVAHGNLSMEADFCKLRAGPHVVHFTGYLPQGTLATKEFCEDIPSTGRAVIVLDFVDARLRDLPVAFKIIASDSPEGPAVIDLPMRSYPNGTIAVEHEFTAAGRFVGILTVQGTPTQVARFPFSVGSPGSPLTHAAMAAAGLALVVAVYRFGRRQRRTAAKPPAE